MIDAALAFELGERNDAEAERQRNARLHGADTSAGKHTIAGERDDAG